MSSLIDVFGAGGFDASSVEPAAEFSILPPFNYAVKIQSCEVKKTKNGNGHFVAIEMEIIDGSEAGRRVWDNINIENPSEQCQKMGRASFSALCRAFDMVNCTDLSVFIDQYVVAHVKVSVNKNTQEKENRVRTYSPAKDYVPPAAGASQASVTPGPAPAALIVPVGVAPVPVVPMVPPVASTAAPFAAPLAQEQEWLAQRATAPVQPVTPAVPVVPVVAPAMSPVPVNTAAPVVTPVDTTAPVTPWAR